MAELKTAQNRIKTKRSVTEAEEQMILDEYAKSDSEVFASHNGPMNYGMRSPSPERATPIFSRPPKSPSPERNFVNELKVKSPTPERRSTTPSSYRGVEQTFDLGLRTPPPVQKHPSSSSYSSSMTRSYEKNFLPERGYGKLQVNGGSASIVLPPSMNRPRSPDRGRMFERPSRPLERSQTMPTHQRSLSMEHTYDLEVDNSRRPLSPEPKFKGEASWKTSHHDRFRTTSPHPIPRSSSLNYGRDYVGSHRRSHSLSEATTTEKMEGNYFVSGLERPAFTTQQTKYVFAISPPKTSQADNSGKTSGRTSAPPTPTRTSSRDWMTRARTLQQEWSSPQHRPITRKLSDTAVYDRDPLNYYPTVGGPASAHAPPHRPYTPLIDPVAQSSSTHNYSSMPPPSSNQGNRGPSPNDVVEEAVIKMSVPKAAGKSLGTNQSH